MQGPINFLRQFSADTLDQRKRVDPGIAHALQSAEVLQQHFAAFGADVGNVFERGMEPCFAAFCAVPGDGEAVGLVADTLNEVKPWVVFGEFQFSAIGKYQRLKSWLAGFTLGHAE